MRTKIVTNIDHINDRIRNACILNNRNVQDITLVAVSKRKNNELIKFALDHGIKDFGENYAQEMKEKSETIDSDEINWHFIGPIQTNKIKIIAKHAHWVHTLDREKVIKKLDSECKKIDKNINAFIQVNISNENTKNGCDPKDIIEVGKLVESMTNINLKGLMFLPKLNVDPIENKRVMKLAKELSLKLQAINNNANAISLGTTSDFEEAIANGSTMLRIGESIFGKRV
ncbi:YggS family pyridoxal phosphate-dependent enzyme [Gammaproteobacteria bacterium]|mgnify:FL=1|nr:YggS family pyridoxal phosphate-dependent enzyme [Gammaproteobacteria bacterium]|tara:strand:+ start:1289 stop:1975 length:687 start_codon:yes stop_codon:yes gene_type:complete